MICTGTSHLLKELTEAVLNGGDRLHEAVVTMSHLLVQVVQYSCSFFCEDFHANFL